MLTKVQVKSNVSDLLDIKSTRKAPGPTWFSQRDHVVRDSKSGDRLVLAYRGLYGGGSRKGRWEDVSNRKPPPEPLLHRFTWPLRRREGGGQDNFLVSVQVPQSDKN